MFYIVINHDATKSGHRVSAFRFDDPEAVLTWLYDRDIEDYTILKYEDDPMVGTLIKVIRFDDKANPTLKDLAALL